MPNPICNRPKTLRLIRTLAALAPLVLAQSVALPVSYGASGAAPAPRNVVTFGTQTATSTAPDSRGIFRFGATAGGLVDDHVAVINYSLQPVTLQLKPVDAVNTPQGGFAALPVNETSKELGTWVTLPAWASTITLGPRSNKIIPFALNVPADASPGDHFGVITATLVSSALSNTGERIRLLQTVGTRVFLRVSGPLRPGFTIENLQVGYTGNLNPIGSGRGVLTYTIRNTGNVALGGRQKVYVSGLFGSKSVARRVVDVQLLLPGSSVKETIRVSGIFPEFRETAHVSISPLYIAGTVQPASGPYTADTAFWAIPWSLLATIVLLVVIGAVLLWLRRRHRNRPPERAGGPDRNGGPAAEASWESAGAPGSAAAGKSAHVEGREPGLVGAIAKDTRQTPQR